MDISLRRVRDGNESRTEHLRMAAAQGALQLTSVLDRHCGRRKRRMNRFWACVGIVVLAARASADSPLSPPSRIARCSPNRQFCAEADPEQKAVVGYRRGDRLTERWRLEGWER